MKLLCISDMHGNVPDFSKIVEKHKPSAILCGGDAMGHGWLGEEDRMEECIEALIETGLPVFYVSGNMDDPAFLITMDELVDDFHLIDYRKIEFEGYTIVGIGTCWNPIDKITLQELIKDDDNLIFLNHVPPFECVDFATVWGKEHAGDPIFRDHIREFNPIFTLSGHIHEAKGTDKIDDTLVINSACSIGIIELEGKNATVSFVESFKDVFHEEE